MGPICLNDKEFWKLIDAPMHRHTLCIYIIRFPPLWAMNSGGTMIPSLEKKTGPRILVVDDDPNEMRSLVIGLRLEGFDAIGVADGASALRSLSESSFAAVIVDLMMPEMNGLQLARAMRAEYPTVITMLMSAYHLSPIQLARADTGVVGFIPKPFCFDELVRFLVTKLHSGNREDLLSDSSDTSRSNGLNAPVEIPTVISDRPSRIPLAGPAESHVMK